MNSNEAALTESVIEAYARQEAALRRAEAIIKRQTAILRVWGRAINEVSHHKGPSGRLARRALRRANSKQNRIEP